STPQKPARRAMDAPSPTRSVPWVRSIIRWPDGVCEEEKDDEEAHNDLARPDPCRSGGNGDDRSCVWRHRGSRIRPRRRRRWRADGKRIAEEAGRDWRDLQ